MADVTIKLDSSAVSEINKGGCCKSKKKKSKYNIRNKNFILRQSNISTSLSEDKDLSVF